MTVYEQVEKMLTQDDDRPAWADEILFELKEIKKILKSNIFKNKNTPRDKAYFAFVNDLRKKLRASIEYDNFPEIDYKGRKLGINFKGWIYDKDSSKVLPSHEAFDVYRFLYAEKENIDKYLRL